MLWRGSADSNLDKLAKNGLRFKQFYNSARCCPSRAALLTGLYPHQAGIGHMTNDPEDSTAFNYGVPAYQGDINNQSVTIAEVLKSAGYTTFMTGKWHLGYHDPSRWPLQRGFDKYYGILAGASNYFHPTGERGLTLMNKSVEPEGDDFYITDAFTNYAIKFINENKSAQQKNRSSSTWLTQVLTGRSTHYRPMSISIETNTKKVGALYEKPALRR
ncbi:sulfatase-like hydrolase/transferase [Niabella hibiscisoli]|uniref:sulfatase-like hydrolase/transferase n=1 Tax=Niabella hibiscisoli TaxID=1825928 RepID=UPI0021D4643B|nr:sulfatase-like hydrolase/transferase [Niabella hibiscisoli]